MSSKQGSIHGYEDLFLYYIKYTYYPDSQYVICYTDNNACVTKFIKEWDIFVNSLWSYDIVSARSAIERLRTYNINVLFNSAFLLEVLEEIVDNAIDPYLNGNVYSFTTVLSANQWWRQPPKLNIEVNKILSKYFEPTCNFVPKYGSIINLLTNINSKCNEFALVTVERCLLLFSAYCYALAETALLKKQFNTSLLLSYRSLDLYFQSLCKKYGIITLTSVLKYDSYINERNMVTMINSELRLTDTSSIVQDTNRLTFVKWLNERRKTHLFTHNVSYSTYDDANIALMGVKKTISDIEGTSEWFSLSKMYFNFHKITHTLLFDVEDSVDSYITVT